MQTRPTKKKRYRSRIWKIRRIELLPVIPEEESIPWHTREENRETPKTTSRRAATRAVGDVVFDVGRVFASSAPIKASSSITSRLTWCGVSSRRQGKFAPAVIPVTAPSTSDRSQMRLKGPVTWPWSLSPQTGCADRFQENFGSSSVCSMPRGFSGDRSGIGQE